MREAEIFSLITTTDSPSDDEVVRKQRLSYLLNELILHDFHTLVQILYRVDVPEKELKELLQQQPGTDAGILLADMLIKRQKEKELLRKGYRSDNTDIPEEDRW